MQVTGEGYRLSAQQEHLLRQYRQGRGRGGWGWLAVEIRGDLDARLLREAVDAVVERHEILRTGIRVAPGLELPLQVIGAGRVEWGGEADWSGSTPAGIGALLHRQAAEALRDPLDLDRDPHLRASLARVGAREHLLSIRVPALLADETTLRELPAEIGRAYAALAAGEELPGDPLQYADLAEWQNGALEGEGGAEGARHWARRATPAPPLPETLGGVPADPGEARPEFLTLALEPELAHALEAAAAASAAALPELLLGALHVLLYRVTQRPETRVGVYFDGRGYEELRGALGPVGGYLPVDCRPDGGLAMAAVVEQLKREMEEAREWQGSFSPERVQVGSVGFAWHGEPPRASSGGVAFALRDAAAFAEPFALSLACTAGEGGLELRVYHDAARVAAGGAERFAEELHTLLRSIAARPEARVGELDVVGPRELRQVVEEWNRTAAEFPADRCIHQLFAEQAERTPDAVAIVYGDGALTYRELDERANRLAHHLAGLGVGPEVRVGVCLERSLELMVAILGVMKAGGAYVPVDPANPADRIGYVLEDSGVTALLTQARLRGRMPVHDGVRVVEVDGEWGEAAYPGAEPPASGVTAENLCYVIYTSGSTGRPKGVAMHHRGVCNYIHWGIPFYGAERGSGAPVFSSMAVDLTITNLLPLFAGRPVRFLREESSVEALAEALRERPGFGLIKITPTHLALLNPLLTPEEARAAAVTLVVGADLLNAEPTVFWQENAPGVRLMNEYGPTETVVGCSAYVLPNGVHRAGPVPVGGAIQNLTFFVLDERMRPVPVGSPGELYIGGVGVARGYLGRPALSAEKFVPDPFAEPGARMYRTGDRARWLDGGNLMILGRTDNQVKIRGYRVELGEVEAALLELPSVREAVVLAREDVPGERRLVAYLVPAAGEAPTTSELRASLLELVPEYMVPSVFVTLERLPLNTGGKLDRRALPEPGPERPELDQEYVAPRDDVEEALAEIWSEVLQVDVVGVRDDFFELGGNSFMAVRLMSRIEKRFGPALPLATLIQAGTIEKIAKLLSASEVEPRRDYLVPIQPGGSRPPLYCIHTGEGTVLCYRKLRELGPDQPVYGIQALDFDIGRKPLADVEKLAARYVDAIVEFQPEGPCLLAGWSFGGIVAWEMARQLHRRGREVERVVLFDCKHPITRTSMEEVDPALRRISLLFDLADLVRDGKPVVDPADLVGLRLDEQLALIAGRLGVPVRKLIPAHIGADRVEEYLDIRMMRDLGADRYVPGEYPGRGVTLFRARDLDLDTPFPTMREAFLEAERSADYGWGELCREPVEVRTVPGTHETLFTERYIGGLVRELRLCLGGEDAATGDDRDTSA